jgi:uncharacterized damage-inducible protein DinB
LRTNDLLIDSFTRVRDGVREAVTGLSDDDLSFRADPEANSIAWLVWHLTRVQDDHVAELAARPQAWTSAGWAQRFALPFDVWDTGYGHRSADVGAVKAGADQLARYHEAVFEDTVEFLKGLGDDDLDRIVDRRWDPPVTLGIRLVSVIGDDLQHLGQAAFVRGLLQRRGHSS